MYRNIYKASSIIQKSQQDASNSNTVKTKTRLACTNSGSEKNYTNTKIIIFYPQMFTFDLKNTLICLRPYIG